MRAETVGAPAFADSGGRVAASRHAAGVVEGSMKHLGVQRPDGLVDGFSTHTTY